MATGEYKLTPTGADIEATLNKVPQLEAGITEQNEKLAQLDQKVENLFAGGGGGGGVGIYDAEVSVDDTTGTPSADATIESGVLKLSFSGLKGEKGEQGEKGSDGVQGPIGETGATGATGSPGITSAEVSVDETIGIPAVTATIDNKVLKLNFTGLKGAQGNSGYQGVAGELEIVNNLTDGGEAAALSAEMGKELGDRLANLLAVEEEVISNEDFVLNEGYLKATSVGESATITSGSTLRYSDPMAVLAGDIVEVESQGTGIACIATTDATGSLYIARAISNDGNTIKTYSYEVTEDGYIAISSRATALSGRVLRKTGDNKIAHLEENIETIESDLLQLSKTIYGSQISIDINELITSPCSLGANAWFYESTLSTKPAHKAIAIPTNTHNVIINTQTIGTYIGFLTDGYNPPYSGNQSIPYVSGTDRIRIPDRAVGTDYAIEIPQGAAWLILNYIDGSGTKMEYNRVSFSMSDSATRLIEQIGSLLKLQTSTKNSIVDAINEIVSIYPTTSLQDVSGSFSFSTGQAYGNDGSSIVISTNTLWRHIRLTKADNISIVKVSAANNVSSLIQYVDDNDVIISRDLVSPAATTLYEISLSFPEGATAVYVSSYPNAPVLLREAAIGMQGGASASPVRFRCLSWNIGHYAKGNAASSAITAENYESQKMAFRKVFNKYGADIVGLCEYSSIFYDGETAASAILSQYKNAYVAPTESGYVGTALYSAFGLESLTEYAVGSNKAYEGILKAGGKEIIICMCHVPWTNDATNKAGLQTMIDRYADKPYVVIMGDMNFNTGHEEECAAMFTEAGYQNANWGYLGKILTSYNNNIASNYLDNIAVKGGSILHTEVLQNTPEGIEPDAEPNLSDESLWDAVNLSDHFPIICDIAF